MSWLALLQLIIHVIHFAHGEVCQWSYDTVGTCQTGPFCKSLPYPKPAVYCSPSITGTPRICCPQHTYESSKLQGIYCYLPYGNMGTCKPLVKCPAANVEVSYGRPVTYCHHNWNYADAMVCCPEKTKRFPISMPGEKVQPTSSEKPPTFSPGRRPVIFRGRPTEPTLNHDSNVPSNRAENRTVENEDSDSTHKLDVIPSSHGTSDSSDKFDISPPFLDFECGIVRVAADEDEDVYRLNKTAALLQKKGLVVYNVQVKDDVIIGFEYTNGTHHWAEPKKHSVAGGEDARRTIATYMALIGDHVEKNSNEIEWFCGGSLINDRWILTAGHCLNSKSRCSPLSRCIVRLGGYDYKDTKETTRMDVGISSIVLHPDFKPPAVYHDLALVKLSSSVPLSTYISPICLPWGAEAGKRYLWKSVTVSGWGSTGFLLGSSAVLQEVNVTVFDTKSCDKDYQRLWDYKMKWPRGITPDTMMCAGDPFGGKDSCPGDSGGPLVHENKGKPMLLGVVSSGFGCGHPDYPGLYVAANNPQYISWIKSIAF